MGSDLRLYNESLFVATGIQFSGWRIRVKQAGVPDSEIQFPSCGELLSSIAMSGFRSGVGVVAFCWFLLCGGDYHRTV
jgi:hypothetical protein